MTTSSLLTRIRIEKWEQPSVFNCSVDGTDFEMLFDIYNDRVSVLSECCKATLITNSQLHVNRLQQQRQKIAAVENGARASLPLQRTIRSLDSRIRSFKQLAMFPPKNETCCCEKCNEPVEADYRLISVEIALLPEFLEYWIATQLNPLLTILIIDNFLDELSKLIYDAKPPYRRKHSSKSRFNNNLVGIPAWAERVN